MRICGNLSLTNGGKPEELINLKDSADDCMAPKCFIGGPPTQNVKQTCR